MDSNYDRRIGFFGRLHIGFSRLFYRLFDTPDIPDVNTNPFKAFLELNETDPGLFHSMNHPDPSMRGCSRRARISRFHTTDVMFHRIITKREESQMREQFKDLVK